MSTYASRGRRHRRTRTDEATTPGPAPMVARWVPVADGLCMVWRRAAEVDRAAHCDRAA